MPETPKYSLQQLQDYIQITQFFVGEIKEITVTQEFLVWYNNQVKQVAKNLNIPTTKNYAEPKYMSVKLVVK